MDKSKFRLMWLMVMFDLPVTEKSERRSATQFRNFLLDEGFEMSQFSVYFRFIGEKERSKPIVKRIKEALPANGKVSILFFTDKQFSDILYFHDRTLVENAEIPDQLALF
ncbi:CRISPR-associated endonuclease Cas2 [Kangiella japonica]|uniref:CRISPR-associated endoribonuclease Cas2 n=1 Tax=Kangiella japonica TaxID=647384 RepID=A0ABN0T6X5_9GAMM